MEFMMIQVQDELFMPQMLLLVYLPGGMKQKRFITCMTCTFLHKLHLITKVHCQLGL
jgi:hypothetical protein